MLGRVSQATLAKAAADPRYLALYRSACETYDLRTRKNNRRPTAN
jgi:glycogen phosphorylase